VIAWQAFSLENEIEESLLSVSNELQVPVSEDDFEAMCLMLYSLAWDTNDLMRMGRTGQTQFGVDIVGHDGKRNVGIQCKHYVKTKFTIKTIADDVEAADKAGLPIDHLLFATTAPAKAELVKAVLELSSARRAHKKFTVSVDFWNTISDRIRLHPEVGRAFIPGYSGSTMLLIAETTTETLAVVQESVTRQESTSRQIVDAINNLSSSRQVLAPDARGDEADPGVVASLDHVRDRIRAGATTDARQLLKNLGDPGVFRDEFSKFRWHTNIAAIAMIDGDDDRAAQGFLDAFQFAQHDEKAHVNRAQAYFLRKQFQAADIACDEALKLFPDSAVLWGMSLHLREANLRPAPEVPDSVLDNEDFLFSKSRLIGAKGEHQAAIEMLLRCLEENGESLDARRALLAEALSWTLQDSISSVVSQPSQEQRQALEDALNRFEPLETLLPAQQSDRVSEELATNAVSSLLILGHEVRARRLAQQLLARHPRLEQLLRVRIAELDDVKDTPGIHALTDGRLCELPSSVLALLAEISAHRGDVEWFTEILAAASRKFEDDVKLKSIRPLEYVAQWNHGDKELALGGVTDFTSLNPDDVLARMIRARFLLHAGKRSDAIALTRESAGSIQLGERINGLSAVYVGDMFLALHLYDEAASIYEKLVRIPRPDELTEKLLMCLLMSDQRSKTMRLLEAMPAAARELPNIKRVEINLAGGMGDWRRVIALIKPELVRDPDDADSVLAYADALFRMNDRSELRLLAEQDPRLKNAKPKQELAFAQYQMCVGVSELAIRRLYRLFRANPSNAEIAGHILGRILLGESSTSLIAAPSISPGSAVKLKHGTEVVTVAIEYGDTDFVGAWPELVSAKSEVAVRLNGLQVGDQATIGYGMFEREFEVVAIETLIAYALGKANELIAAQANPKGPLWSVRVIKEDGQVDIEMLQRSARERRLAMEDSFRFYKQHRVPTCVLAKLIGTDPVTLQLEWPSRLASLYVGVGRAEDHKAALARIADPNQVFVMDVLTIAELVHRGVSQAIACLPGRPLVAQTQRQRLLGILDAMSEPRETANMTEEDGQLRIRDIPPWYFAGRKRLLLSMLNFMDTSCDVVPVVGPEVLTREHRSLAHILERDALDTLYLCLERKGSLLSEDGGLRALAAGAGIESSMSIQSLLMDAVKRGVLSRDSYVNAVASKLLANHDFTSVGAEDLLQMALKTPQRIAPAVLSALESFRRSSLDLPSGVRVCIEFMELAAKKLEPSVLGRYCSLILEVLQYDRPRFERVLEKLIAKRVRALIGRNGRRIPPHARRTFSKRLLQRR
jgi:tetratricopeptide (TPR) repeat protein